MEPTSTNTTVELNEAPDPSVAASTDSEMAGRIDEYWPIPMRAIGAQNLLTMPGGVAVSGYLHKKGGSQWKIMKWPLRFVIIHKACIYYFKTSTSPFPQGAFSLNGYNRVMRATEETTSSNVFPFKIIHFNRKHRTWFFSASCEEERKMWMMTLRKEIDHYHEKTDSQGSSDTNSDSDSFYGSIELPVAIKYVPGQTTSGDYDDEEDYLKPDDFLPQQQEPPEYPENRKPSLPPLPPPNKPKFIQNQNLAVSPPPRPEKFKPPSLASHWSAPPPGYLKALPSAKELQQKPKVIPSCPNFSAKSPNLLIDELITQNQHRRMSEAEAPPLPLNKPKFKVNSPPYEIAKPTLYKPDILPKPGATSPKPPPLASKPKARKPSNVSLVTLQRISPEGQSFRLPEIEKPKTWQSTQESSHSPDDDDDDYENVQLPSSVFINTTESSDVERLFKSGSPAHKPLNGLYGIRNSSSRTGQVLVVWDESEKKVRNYRIFATDSKFFLESDTKFTSLANMIDFYYHNLLPSHTSLRLREPYGYKNLL
ncbi:SH3 domain-binding protein 2 isoform X1 [Callorhinchus milii]|nr:SH3 domain-binding protein 2 isoform X1 [Callorhinchus milii]|eukprot:gi/632974026/ref/XP_007903444.1/ PREDICTED: SH3 domain-binding protein 2 isoform X2 [Callorhinchus milii]